MLVTGAKVPCEQASPGGERVLGLIIRENPRLQEEEDRDWRGTGGKDGNTTAEARRGNAMTSSQ